MSSFMHNECFYQFKTFTIVLETFSNRYETNPSQLCPFDLKLLVQALLYLR